MAEYLIQDSTLTAIGDAIREKTKKTDAILVSDLASEISSISGGADLNFDVVGGTTQPTNPIENMIWINTNVEITGWIFSSTEPENITEGMVWFVTGTNSDFIFNALKENTLNVYPLFVRQYINNQWNADKIISI